MDDHPARVLGVVLGDLGAGELALGHDGRERKSEEKDGYCIQKETEEQKKKVADEAKRQFGLMSSGEKRSSVMRVMRGQTDHTFSADSASHKTAGVIPTRFTQYTVVCLSDAGMHVHPKIRLSRTDAWESCTVCTGENPSENGITDSTACYSGYYSTEQLLGDIDKGSQYLLS